MYCNIRVIPVKGDLTIGLLYFFLCGIAFNDPLCLAFGEYTAAFARTMTGGTVIMSSLKSIPVGNRAFPHTPVSALTAFGGEHMFCLVKLGWVRLR